MNGGNEVNQKKEIKPVEIGPQFEDLFQRNENNASLDINQNSDQFAESYKRANLVKNKIDNSVFNAIAKNIVKDASLEKSKEEQEKEHDKSINKLRDEANAEYGSEVQAVVDKKFVPQWCKNKKIKKLTKKALLDSRYDEPKESFKQRYQAAQAKSIDLLQEINSMNKQHVVDESKALGRMDPELRLKVMENPDLLGLMRIKDKSDAASKLREDKLIRAFLPGENQQQDEKAMVDSIETVANHLEKFEEKKPDAFKSPNVNPAEPLDQELFSVYKVGFHAYSLINKNSDAKQALEKKNPEALQRLEKAYGFFQVYKAYLDFKTQNGIDVIDQKNLPEEAKAARLNILELESKFGKLNTGDT